MKNEKPSRAAAKKKKWFKRLRTAGSVAAGIALAILLRRK